MLDLNFQPLSLTFKLAFITTVVLFFLGIPLAYWITHSRLKIKFFIQAIISLPLVLPPSVLGFYLLLAFNPNYFPGKFLATMFNLRLVFSFSGLVVGSVIFSLPFMVNPLLSGFESLPRSLSEAAFTLGTSKLKTLLSVQLPNMKPALITGIVLSFAHTVGEFGLVLMIGGSIPGETLVASIAIYNEVEALNYSTAHFYALVLLAINFFILLTVNILNRKLLKPF